MCSKFSLGDVLKWHDYPHPDDEKSEIKNNWFIVVGDTGLLEEPKQSILVRPTSQLSHYGPFGKRRDNYHIILHDYGQYGLTHKCVVDFSFPPNKKHTEEGINRKLDANIVDKKGKVTMDVLKLFYEELLKSRSYSTIEKKQIHTSLNRIGITGLSQPKSNNHRKRR